MRERKPFALILMGVVWLIIAAIWGYTLYTKVEHVPNLLTYGLCTLLAGLFFGRAIQKMRTSKELVSKTPAEE
jgi:MFS-type transporter involved in bile tolerance (Atg22 family)